MTTVAIIGTAGRDSSHRLTPELFQRMVNLTIGYLRKLSTEQNLILVSGGAAWSDHLAVHLYLHRSTYQLPIMSLCLHLPCPFDSSSNKYLDNGARDWRINPGWLANYYHEKFNVNSLAEISEAIRQGAVVNVWNGFHARNSKIAQAMYLLAFTWHTHQPDDGGTKDTWNKALGVKTHVSLQTLVPGYYPPSAGQPLQQYPPPLAAQQYFSPQPPFQAPATQPPFQAPATQSPFQAPIVVQPTPSQSTVTPLVAPLSSNIPPVTSPSSITNPPPVASPPSTFLVPLVSPTNPTPVGSGETGLTGKMEDILTTLSGLTIAGVVDKTSVFRFPGYS